MGDRKFDFNFILWSSFVLILVLIVDWEEVLYILKDSIEIGVVFLFDR